MNQICDPNTQEIVQYQDAQNRGMLINPRPLANRPHFREDREIGYRRLADNNNNHNNQGQLVPRETNPNHKAINKYVPILRNFYLFTVLRMFIRLEIAEPHQN